MFLFLDKMSNTPHEDGKMPIETLGNEMKE